MMEIDGKSCFSVKKIISTSEWRAEHLFAGQNTQHIRRLIQQKFICKLTDCDPAMVAEWSKTLVQIQVAISPLQTQIHSLLRACMSLLNPESGIRT